MYICFLCVEPQLVHPNSTRNRVPNRGGQLDSSDESFLFWIAGMSLRQASRQRRGNVLDARLDIIDTDFLRHRLDEAHTCSIEEIGISTLFDDKDAISSIVGCIIVQPNGSWEDPLTINGAQRRWSAYFKFIFFL